MKSLNKRLDDIKHVLSGFSGEADRQDAIKYLRSLDPEIKAEDIKGIDDYFNELKSFFAPLPNTDAWDDWLGTDQHKKYMERQKRKQEQQTLVN